MFKLMIELGNDAMRDGHDLSCALEGVASDLRGGREDGAIRDANGNTVGEWTLRPDAPRCGARR